MVAWKRVKGATKKISEFKIEIKSKTSKLLTRYSNYWATKNHCEQGGLLIWSFFSMVRESDRRYGGCRFYSCLGLWNPFNCSFVRCQATIISHTGSFEEWNTFSLCSPYPWVSNIDFQLEWFFKWLSKYQKSNYHSNQSQQEQIVRWTNQNS